MVTIRKGVPQSYRGLPAGCIVASLRISSEWPMSAPSVGATTTKNTTKFTNPSSYASLWFCPLGGHFSFIFGRSVGLRGEGRSKIAESHFSSGPSFGISFNMSIKDDMERLLFRCDHFCAERAWCWPLCGGQLAPGCNVLGMGARCWTGFALFARWECICVCTSK